MSKSKLFGIGLASALSLLSVGCSDNKSDVKSKKAPMTEQSVKSRQQNGREDVSVSFINRKKDYVKSINCLLSLHKEVIPLVEKQANQIGIEAAIHQAYSQCRMNGLLKENSVAYNFDDIVAKNYGGNDLEQWKQSFTTAGKEAEKILSEGDSVSRKFVPAPTSQPEFLRRNVEQTNVNTWKTANDAEKDHYIYTQAKKWAAQDRQNQYQ